MVKKLLGYEIKYYLHIVIFYLPVTFLMGLIVRIVQFFKTDHYIYDFLFSSSLLLLYVASAVALIATLVLAVVRFYKNLYSAEGYLTFALPVNNHQIIISKLLGFIIFQVITFVSVALGWIVAFIGVGSVWETIKYLFELIASIPEKGQVALIIIEIIILGALLAITSPLIYYSCITIGQTAKKHKILLSIGIYYGYSVILQILSTVFSIILMLMGTSGLFESLGIWISNHPFASIHIFFWVIILIIAGVGVLLYTVIYKIMTNKLNLE